MFRSILFWTLFVVFVLALASGAGAANCNATSVGRTPLNDLGGGLYLGQFQGGLYPEGANQPPPLHHVEAQARATSLQPLNGAGQPDPDGAIVLLSVGMSNATQEFCSQSSDPPCSPWSFMGQAASHPDVDHETMEIVNGAMGGQSAMTWETPEDENYHRILVSKLLPRGLTEAQVQAVWLKTVTGFPTVHLPSPAAEAFDLVSSYGNIARALKVRYPNLELLFFASRTYAGYATSQQHPEPYAYESGFAVKWVIEAQSGQMAGGGMDPLAGDLDYSDGTAPLLLWGPYLWADGLVPRSDGLIWECGDFVADGTHPARDGEEKVADQLLEFMLTSPYAAPWFARTSVIFSDGFESGNTGAWTTVVE